MYCFYHFDLETCFAPLFENLSVQSALNVVCVLPILTWKCASLLNISISKSAPKLKCFVHLDVETYFAPQRCAPFPNLNFQKSEPHHHCWQGPVPRLMIRQIVLENFKSYGGVKVQGWAPPHVGDVRRSQVVNVATMHRHSLDAFVPPNHLQRFYISHATTNNTYCNITS